LEGVARSPVIAVGAFEWLILVLFVLAVAAATFVVVRRRRRGGGVIATRPKR
jgi:hypothetical protein